MKTQPAEEENLFSEPAVVSEEKGERQWQKKNPVITIEMTNGDIIKAELYPDVAQIR